jgi:hypothetical protein
MSDLWLPTGHLTSWNLHVLRQPAPNAGAFQSDATWKFTLHSTETPEDSQAAIVRQFSGGVDTPHFVLGIVPGLEDWVLTQLIDLDHSGASLEHPLGTKETNRAKSIQMEVCGFAKNAPEWSDKKYNAVAAAICLTSHRVPIAHRIPRKFTATPNRYTQQGWIKAGGINGHQHAASQIRFNHWDPGNISESKLLNAIERIDH